MNCFLFTPIFIATSLSFASADTHPSCKDLGFSKGEPLAVWKMANKAELVVCEVGQTAKTSNDEFIGWANVYERSNGKMSPFINEVNSERQSEIDSFHIKRIDHSRVSVTRLIRSPYADATGDSDTPVTTFEIKCTGKKPLCRKGHDICVKPKNKKVDKDAIATIESIAAGRIKADSLPAYDVVIGKVVDSALAGNKRALRLVLDTSTERLHTDGAATETLTDGKDLIRKLMDLKCLKR